MRHSRHTHASRSKIHELAGGDHLSSTIIARAESRKNFFQVRLSGQTAAVSVSRCLPESVSKILSEPVYWRAPTAVHLGQAAAHQSW
jgi:hypothetical protein